MSIDFAGTQSVAAWAHFVPGPWQDQIDVRDFVHRNQLAWSGVDHEGSGPTARVRALCQQAAERTGDWTAELVVALPARFWRSLARPVPSGGVGVDEVFPHRVRAARAAGLLSGPAGGGGRVLGDIRRVALYGLDVLSAAKRAERDQLDALPSTEDVVRRRLELADQLAGFAALAELGAAAGLDLSGPARSALEAAQWMLLAYLAGLAEHPSAEPAWGRASGFLDVYIERDLRSGVLTELRAQEVVDDILLVLGLVQALRPSGDVVVTLGGMSDDGRPLVTRTCVRHLRSVVHLAPAPVPRLAVLWSSELPTAFRRAAAAASLVGGLVGFVSDNLVRASWGDDAAVVGPAWTAVRIGGQVLYGGVRVNLAKAVLYAVDAGRDELTGRQVGPLTSSLNEAVLTDAALLERLEETLEWVAAAAVDHVVCAHATRDREGAERLPMALSDAMVLRTLVCEVVGSANAADSLAAVRYAEVRPVRSTDGVLVGVQVTGEVPRFGRDDDRADDLAVWLLRTFMSALRRQQTYRGAIHAQALVRPLAADGQMTGATLDGRAAQAPLFARTGAPGELTASVAKLPYADAQAGLACPFPVRRTDLGESAEEQAVGLVALVDSALCAGGAYGVVVLPR